MQAAIVQKVQAVSSERKAATNRMTYQITMRGSDGMVLASDKRELLLPQTPEEGEGAVTNMLNKIRIDSTGRFAWAFAGAKPSLLASSYLERELENGIADRDVERVLRDCGDRGWEHGAAGPSNSSVVLADGKSKSIFRATLAHKATMVIKIDDGRCFTGQNYAKASFFPLRFYSSEMSVEQLARLAAYAVLMAGEMDPLCVSGLDMAVYSDSTGRFEFADRTMCAQEVLNLDAAIRHLFTS